MGDGNVLEVQKLTAYYQMFYCGEQREVRASTTSR